MTEEQERERHQFKITTITVFLGFVCQLMASAWFLASLSERQAQTHSVLQGVVAEQKLRSSNVYAVENLKTEIRWCIDEVKEMRQRLRGLEMGHNGQR